MLGCAQGSVLRDHSWRFSGIKPRLVVYKASASAVSSALFLHSSYSHTWFTTGLQFRGPCADNPNLSTHTGEYALKSSLPPTGPKGSQSCVKVPSPRLLLPWRLQPRSTQSETWHHLLPFSSISLPRLLGKNCQLPLQKISKVATGETGQ